MIKNVYLKKVLIAFSILFIIFSAFTVSLAKDDKDKTFKEIVHDEKGRIL